MACLGHKGHKIHFEETTGKYLPDRQFKLMICEPLSEPAWHELIGGTKFIAVQNQKTIDSLNNARAESGFSQLIARVPKPTSDTRAISWIGFEHHCQCDEN